MNKFKLPLRFTGIIVAVTVIPFLNYGCSARSINKNSSTILQAKAKPSPAPAKVSNHLDVSRLNGVVALPVANGMNINVLGGSRSQFVNFDTKSLKATTIDGTSWQLVDATGHRFIITNNNAKCVVLINRNDSDAMITYGNQAGFIKLPGRGLIIANEPKWPITVKMSIPGRPLAGLTSTLSRSKLPVIALCDDDGITMRPGRVPLSIPLSRQSQKN